MRYPVLLHGFTGSSASWGDGLVDGLASAGHAPVFLDLPGHGRLGTESDSSRFTLEATLDLLTGVGDWPADLIGYSMGGRIALHFAAAYPDRVRRLVLESASPGLAAETERSERRETDEILAARLEADGVEAFIDEWERIPLFESQARLDPGLRARQREIRLANDARGMAASLRRLGTGTLPSLWDRLPEIEVPTLLLVGQLDRKFVEVGERMARATPKSRLHVVPGAGHAVHLERPDAWLDAVTGFLAEG